MCNYYYAVVRWRDCEQDPKHTGSIRKEVTCEEAEKTGKECPNPTEMPWQSGSTSIKGPCYKCGKHIFVTTHSTNSDQIQPTPNEFSPPIPYISFGVCERQSHR